MLKPNHHMFILIQLFLLIILPICVFLREAQIALCKTETEPLLVISKEFLKILKNFYSVWNIRWRDRLSYVKMVIFM